MEIAQVVKVDFDNMENRYSGAIRKEVVATFLPTADADASKLARDWAASQEAATYTGWDGNVYPRYEIVTFRIINEAMEG